MNNLVFVSVAFGAQYIEQQNRLRESILTIYPQAALLFWTNCYPPDSRNFYQSLYGFKPHAIMEARRQGFRRIIWCDTAMILQGPVDDLLKYKIVAVQDDNKLAQFISDAYLERNKLTREELKKMPWHLVGGSLYYFDFYEAVTKNIFRRWLIDEMDGMYGTQEQEASEQLQGHRGDETCMAMAFYKNMIQPQSAAEVRYNVEENPMFTKKHFK